MAEKSHQTQEGDFNLMNGIHYTGNKGPCFGARHIMIIVLAFGISTTAVTKSVFSVLIIAMTSGNTSSNADIPTYDWDNKGVVISSVIWLGIPIQLLAGQLGKQYGHKWLIMGSVAINAVFFMLIPVFAKIWGSTGVIVCRVIEGGAIGVLGPVAAGVSGLWIPAEERSTAGMINIGIAYIVSIIFYVSAGQIVKSSWGYPTVCYIVGTFSLVWCFVWFFLAHQSPATHPRITPEEKKYIETSLSSHKTEHVSIPWLKLLTSVHFWAPVIAAIGTNWIDTIMSSVNLMYSNKAWKVDVGQGTSVLSLPPIIGMVLGIFIAPISDYLIRNNHLRVVNARRIFQTVGIIGNSVVLLWMTLILPGQLGLMIANGVISNVCTILFNIGGANLNILDIAPSFAGVINGFASTISQCIALIAPMAYDWIVKDDARFVLRGA